MEYFYFSKFCQIFLWTPTNKKNWIGKKLKWIDYMLDQEHSRGKSDS